MLNDEIENSLKSILNIIIGITEMVLLYIAWGIFVSVVWNIYLVEVLPIPKITKLFAVVLTIFVRTLTNHATPREVLLSLNEPKTFKSFFIRIMRPITGLILCLIVGYFL